MVVAATLALVVAALTWWALFRSEPTPWGEVEVDGNRVSVRYVGGECDRSARLDVEETDTEVVLTVQVKRGSLSCSDVGVPRTVRARLEAPVGDREVVDGACRLEKYASYLACSD
ncbi:hypothetical protein GCM10007231_18150 [Nocardioides daphniae]|uniref:DUF4307 domain-containing protein n=1 Tax=Nocardioides daphniae TaxID=402297 RepID=A0ABQ1QAX9_9ACTN|nr:hypothetical protein GCM10007231_18150 [Nocardioides daphniae]